MMEITPGNSAIFQKRANVAGNTIRILDAGGSVAPIWLKLTRMGKRFTGYESVDGVNWITVGTSDIIMANNVICRSCRYQQKQFRTMQFGI